MSQYFWPESFRVNDLALGMSERGHDVTVLTGMPNYPSGSYFPGYRGWGPFRETHGKIDVLRVPIVPRRSGRAGWLALNYLSYAGIASLRAAVALDRWDAALVFQTSPVIQAAPAILLRHMRRLPVATWVQDIWPESITASGLVSSRTLVEAARRAARWVYLHSDAVLGQSEAFLPRLGSMGVAPERLHYVPNWAEDVYTKPPGAAPASEAWERGFPMMFAGNLGRVQALDTLLDAATLLKDDTDLRWVFVGDGPLKGWLEAEGQRRGLNGQLEFLGRRPVAEMPALFARAGAMLVSLKRDETMSLTIPSKLQSYLAAGRPVLGCLDGEGARVIEQSGAGFASPAGDAVQFAERVRHMRGLSPTAREAQGRQGRDYYMREFDRDVCLDRMERILADLVRARR